MKTKPVDKLIVTNGAAMRSKYGDKYKSIGKAVDKLIAKDKARDVRTVFVELDAKADMKAHKAKPVKSAKSERASKVAIDALCDAMTPSYLMILGAPDVVPHQNMTNPTSDDDLVVPSDLPYACDEPYSKVISKFLGPTRVVGRLPDLLQGSDPGNLIKLLTVASNWKASPRKTYEKYFAMTAKVWHGSTEQSVSNVFGSASKLKDVPSAGPSWTKTQLKPKSHFINCHGGTPDNQFYGQRGNSYPVAMRASQIDDKIAAGTVCSAECCYGAELYDPVLTQGQAGICHVYLDDGAYGFFGSTTIAYGPSDGNGAADLICQFYLKYILEGASSGRAALQARHDFVSSVNQLDPIDLKTLAQFNLLGDPSIHPVDPRTNPLPAAKSKSFKALPVQLVERSDNRIVRRHKLASRGVALAEMAAFGRKAKLAASQETRKVLSNLAEQAKIGKPEVRGFKIAGGLTPKGIFPARHSSTAFFVVSGKRDPQDRRTWMAFVAKETAGGLIGVRELHCR